MTDELRLIETAGACIARQDWSGAAAAFSDLAARQKPVAPAVAYNCGVAYRRAGDAAAALGWLDIALAGDATHVNALFERAAALVDLGRLREGLAAIDRYLALAPDDADARRTKARVLLALGRWEAAEPAWRAVAEGDPANVEARLAQLRILAETGRHETAAEAARALLRDPSVPAVAVLHELTHAGCGSLPLQVSRLVG